MTIKEYEILLVSLISIDTYSLNNRKITPPIVYFCNKYYQII